MTAEDYLEKLTKEMPNVEAIYEDKIIELIGEEGFRLLCSQGKLELCGCNYGRRLYAR